MDERLAPEFETAIYRIVQELLSNVAKHARASACRISIVRDVDLVRIAVEDDGAGFALAPRGRGARNGLGLIGVRERATLLGGTLAVMTPASGGTRLIVELPTRKERGYDTSANIPG